MCNMDRPKIDELVSVRLGKGKIMLCKYNPKWENEFTTYASGFREALPEPANAWRPYKAVGSNPNEKMKDPSLLTEGL